MMAATEVLPYIRGVFGGDGPVTGCKTYQVLMFMGASQQRDVFAARHQKELGKILERKAR